MKIRTGFTQLVVCMSSAPTHLIIEYPLFHRIRAGGWSNIETADETSTLGAL